MWPEFPLHYDRQRNAGRVPHDWSSERHWQGGNIDRTQRRIRDCSSTQAPSAARIRRGLGELLDDHRLSKPGWLVPIEAWDEVMNEPCGCWWDMTEQDAILARARELGWQG